jgi:hypothetical protein
MSAAAEDLRGCGDDLVVGHVAQWLSDVPTVAERVAQLPVALAQNASASSCRGAAPQRTPTL